MKFLIDTQLLLWAAAAPTRLSRHARKIMGDTANELVFSAASLWEVSIKNSLGRDDFRVDPRVLRRALLDNGYTELAITSEHTVTTGGLPPLHKDPFDRLLLSQALVEGITLFTADERLAEYPAPVRKV